MRSAIDTNVLSALWSREPLSSRASDLLGQAHAAGGLVICGPVYAELMAHPGATGGYLDRFLASTAIVVDFELDEHVWRHAGSRFGANAVRRRQAGSGAPKRLLADFLIGSHACLRADRLLTFERTRYEGDYPDLRIPPAP